MNKDIEDNHIIKFITFLNKNQISSAVKMLPQFFGQIYYQQIQCLFDRFKAANKPQKTIEQLFSKTSKQFQEINQLQVKLIQMKKKRYRELIKEQAVNKAEILDCLQLENYQKATKIAEKHKMSKIIPIIQDLWEYRQLKLSLPFKQSLRSQKQKQFQLSQEGKSIRKMLQQSKKIIQRLNSIIEKTFENFFSHQQKQMQLSQTFFTEKSRSLLSSMLNYHLSYKDYISEMQTHKGRLIELCKQIKIKLNQNSLKTILGIFLQFIQANKSILMDSQSNFKRLKPQQVSNRQEMSYQETVIIITKILPYYCCGQYQSMDGKSNNEILLALASIFQKYQENQNLMKSHKKFIKQITQKQMNIRSFLLKLHCQIRLRAPSQSISSQSRNQTSQIISIFQTDFNNMLQQFDKAKRELKEKMQAEQISLKNSQDERKTNQTNKLASQSPINSTNSEISLIKAQLLQMKELNLQLSILNKELIEKNQVLRKELDQEYKLSNMHKLQNKTLMHKVNKSQSKIMITPFFRESNNQDQILFLKSENERLMKQQNERQNLRKNFEARMVETLAKKQKQKQAQVAKWKQKYSKANKEIDDLYEQMQNLNKIIQEEMSKTKTVLKSMKQESFIYEKINNQKQNLKKSIAGQSIIIEDQIFDDYQIYNQKIRTLQINNIELNQLIQEKQKELCQVKIHYKKETEARQQEWMRQRQLSKKKIEELTIKVVSHSSQNINHLHLFPPGFIFDYYDNEERLFLLKNLISYLGPIKRTRLLYRADNYNKVNFHKYIDHQRHIVVVAKTITGKLVAGYSEEPFDQQEIKKGFGMILSLWARKVFRVKQKKAICYDEYFAIFGNSQLRIRSLEFKLFSNFGIANSYYDNQGQKVHIILGQGQDRQVDLSDYEFYALDLDQ